MALYTYNVNRREGNRGLSSIGWAGAEVDASGWAASGGRCSCCVTAPASTGAGTWSCFKGGCATSTSISFGSGNGVAQIQQERSLATDVLCSWIAGY